MSPPNTRVTLGLSQIPPLAKVTLAPPLSSLEPTQWRPVGEQALYLGSYFASFTPTLPYCCLLGSAMT